MIVYRELSTLCHDLGYSARALYTASNSIEKRYHKVELPKSNGDIRILRVPDIYLKSIQKSISENLLAYEEISPYATAYRPGGSTRVNAAPHVGMPVILKLDIRQFFDHITYPMIKERVFVREKYSEANRILLSVLCVYDHTLPQGTPTAPMISNIIMRRFDDTVGSWCRELQIRYTRYCDDMTFSGDFEPRAVEAFVKKQLLKEGFFLNSGKTITLREGQKKEVTGIVVNEKLSIPALYKKSLRQELYYCRKFGVESHMKKNHIEGSPEAYKKKLLGKIHYILSVEKENHTMQEYKSWILSQQD